MKLWATFALLTVLVVGAAGCGSSDGKASTNNSSSGSPTEPAEATSSGEKAIAADQEEGGAGDCPLSESSVSAAVGEDAPSYDPPIEAEAFICEFSAASADELETDVEARFKNPTVEVTVFPLPDQEQKTPAALQTKLEELAATKEGSAEERKETIGTMTPQPSWGEGAFMELTTHPASEVSTVPYVLAELWYPHQKITVVLPEGSVAKPYAVAKQIGDAAAE